MRRLIALIAAGVAAVVVLAGCRFETGSAAYVGDTRLTKADIDQVISGLKHDKVPVDASNEGQIREQIAGIAVFNEVARRFAGEKGYGTPSTDPAGVSQQIGLPASDPFVQLAATATAYTDLLTQKVTPASLTEADYRDAFNLAVAQNDASPDSYDQVKQVLQQQYASNLASGVAVRNALTDAMKRYGTAVNPLYQPAAYPLFSVTLSNGAPLHLVVLNLGGTTPTVPVFDLPRATPSAGR